MYKKNILIISNSKFISGAELSLIPLINNLRHKFVLIIPSNANFPDSNNNSVAAYSLPFITFHRTFNPLTIIRFIFSLIICSIHLIRIIKKDQIDIIYANTIKANLYACVVKCFTKKKIVWSVRDKLNNTFIEKQCLRQSDQIVSISKFISGQIPNKYQMKNTLIYGGIDTKMWSTIKTVHHSINTILIAHIGQLTRWKNHVDFIESARIISQQFKNIKFQIIGSDLSRREQKYVQELYSLIEDYGLDNNVLFIEHQDDITNVMDQIDILVHPAIDEPFGRVLIESMALKKPVVAYNSGGPGEIVLHNKTGFLAEANNYYQLAEYTMQLIQDKQLRKEFGENGRIRIIENFNIERYVKQMGEIFIL